jgi:hypothetical protein
MQAYSFTSAPMAKSLPEAHKKVMLTLDLLSPAHLQGLFFAALQFH